MSLNEKSIVGESFEDLSAADMAMLTGRNDDGVAPASLSFAVSVLSVSFSACSATVVTRLASCGNCCFTWVRYGLRKTSDPYLTLVIVKGKWHEGDSVS